MTKSDWNSLYNETGLGNVEVWELEALLAYRKPLMGRTAWDTFISNLCELSDLPSDANQLH